MNAPFRIAGAGRLGAAKPAHFSFDGTAHDGLEGDTLASALLANGVHLVGRSFKYHRPRGVLSAGSEEPNALVGIHRDAARKIPNVRATVQELYDGLTAVSQNRWPSLARDVGAVNDLAAPFFSAGFYYKTFMWPKAAWKSVYEPSIRETAGLGHAPDQPDPDRYASRFAHCDVLVAGGGAAGLSAALAAAVTGARVIIADERPNFGGALRFETGAEIDGGDGWSWAQETAAALAAMENVIVLPRTTVFGYYAHNMVALAERLTDHLARPDPDAARERLWQVRARRVVLATGAIERHMVFPDNDRPGIMLASAARVYLNHHGVAVGRNVGVYTANDSAYAAALDLNNAGVRIAAIVDARDAPGGPVLEAARAAGIEVLAGHAVTGTAGRLRVDSMEVAPKGGGAARRIAIDALLMSSGWTPSLHLFSQSRGRVAWDEANGRFLPGADAQDCVSVGACSGTTGCTQRSPKRPPPARRPPSKPAFPPLQGEHPRPRRAGESPRRELGRLPTRSARKRRPESLRRLPERRHRQGHPPGGARGHALDRARQALHHQRHGDRSGQDLEPARPGDRRRPPSASRSPRSGSPPSAPPFTPVTFGAIVGHARGALFDPTRCTTTHSWAAAHGAVFEDVGQWKRAWYFPQARRGHACRRGARMQGRARQRRHLRRLDAGQDRGGRPGCRRLHGVALHQPVAEAGAGALPLWRHAARGRLHL